MRCDFSPSFAFRASKFLLSTLVGGVLVLIPYFDAKAETLCAKKRQSVKGGSVRLQRAVIAVTGNCPKGYTEILNIDAIQGDPGADGEDGSLRIYGDGSGGAITVATSSSLSTSETIAQYTDFTIDAGRTLTVESGTVIRCNGVFTNNGTLQVSTWQGAGRVRGGFGQLHPAEAGVASRAAAYGEYGDASVTRFGGLGGLALPEPSAAMLRYPGHRAGGPGAPHNPGNTNSVSSLSTPAGGAVTILAMNGIANAGSVVANGNLAGPGSGGGSGGIVILASPTSIENSGTISAVGGDGGDSDTRNGVGGGGGGGIVLMISPTITSGTVDVSGGDAGTAGSAGSVSGLPRMGGGGGGGCGGSGGTGGSVTTADTPNSGDAGSTGLLIETLADPTGLF